MHKVRDVMTSPVITAGESEGFGELAARLLDNHVSAVPVLDSHEQVVGVVSEADLLVKEAAMADSSLWGSALRGRRGVMATAELARDLMTSPAKTIDPDASVAEAARVMTASRVKRLPVITPDGRLLGIISRVDVLSVIRRPDQEIQGEVVRAAASHELDLRPDQLDVTVQGGIVTIAGELPSHAVAVDLLRAIRHVEGVINVRSKLAFPVSEPASAPAHRA
jgi:CBS domain-containing protein